MDLEAFRALLTPEGQALLAALPAYDEETALTVGARLRAAHPAGLVAAALTQSRLRARAASKLGPAAHRLYFTPAGLEQATRASVAALRAARFAALGAPRVLDLCCGIGGDLLPIAATGASVLGVERDPVTAAVAAANAAALGLAARVEVRCDDATAVDLDGWDAGFCDPARRGDRGRRFAPESWSPPYSFAVGLMRTLPAAGVKVAPGIPHHAVPDGVEAEWVSDAGAVKEAALWSGALARGPGRRATLLPGGATLTGEGLGAPRVAPPGRWLYEPDGAVVRAGLVAEVAARVEGALLDPSIAYVTSDRLVRTPFATAYEVSDVLPFHLKRLRALLRSRGVGRATVKKRGSAVEPEELRRRLRLEGPGEVTVVLTRVAGEPTVLLAQPVPAIAATNAAP